MKAIIEIEGMSCASCAKNIEKSLKKVNGISDANVNLMTRKAYVEGENLEKKELEKAVSNVGNYTAKKIEFEEENPSSHSHHTHTPSHSGNAEDSEISMWKKKMVVSWIIVIPIMFIMFSERLFGLHLFDEKIMTIILLLLSFPVIFIIGFKILKGGLKGFTSLYFNMDSLIALGAVIAYSTGIFSLFFSSIQDYSGISSMIMAFFMSGKYIESLSRGKAGQEIKKLLELSAKKAVILENKKEKEIDISKLKKDDIMIVYPGGKIPTDGIIIKGESSVDESMVSGESLPIDKKPKDTVIGSTINQDGILYIKATKIGKETFLSNIIKLVEEAQSTKVPIQKFADKVTSIFVPSILIISLLTLIGWFYFTKDISVSIGIAVSVLVIACPCALGLATPTALMVGSGIGAKKGILIKKGEAIQTIKEIKTIIFDKTGTITKGKPEVTDIYSKVKKEYLLDIAASIEKLSEHPLSEAIVKNSKLKKYKTVKNFKILRGRGVKGEIGTKKIVIGNRLLMKENNIELSEFEKKISEFENKGKTAMIVSENSEAIGVIAVADSIKQDSLNAIKELNSKGYKTIMITGDNEKTAKAIAEKVGIKKVIANVLPEEKAEKVKEIQNSEMVVFVGDGINDAPALKQSNVGIAVGTGNDIAIEAGDIVIINGSLEGVVQAINLSKATFEKIKQNLFWAFAYNTIAIPVAIAGFLNPVIAEIAMALSSITVVTNANLLRNKKF